MPLKSCRSISISVFVSALMFAWSVPAVAVEVLLAPSPDVPIPGRRMVVPVYYINAGEKDERVSVPREATCRLGFQEKSREIPAQRIESMPEDETAVPARGQIKILYAVHLPDDIKGTVSLSLPELGESRIAFSVAGKEPNLEPQADESGETDEDEALADLSGIINIYQAYARKVSFYQPLYFLVGAEPEDSKFQFSIKYRLFDPETGLAHRFPWMSGLHFAYTQTSFWNLGSDSAPFEDTSYKPELFYVTQNIETGFSWMKGLFIQAGLQHESNGRGGDESRSTNTVYLEPSFIFLNIIKLAGLRISPQFRLYFDNDDDTNPDLPDYRGHTGLRLTCGYADSVIVDSLFHFAKEGVSTQIDLTYPLHHMLGKNFEVYFQAQYVNALAESLLHYQERNEAWRFGFAIIR